jgi:hypothetical protein
MLLKSEAEETTRTGRTGETTMIGMTNMDGMTRSHVRSSELIPTTSTLVHRAPRMEHLSWVLPSHLTADTRTAILVFGTPPQRDGSRIRTSLVAAPAQQNHALCKFTFTFRGLFCVRLTGSEISLALRKHVMDFKKKKLALAVNYAFGFIT